MGLGHLASMRSAHLFHPSFGFVDLRRLTVPECASKSEKSFVSTRRFGRRKKKTSEDKGSTYPRGTYALRAASPSEGIYSLLGFIAQRLGVRVSPRARPCLRVWSIQLDCSVCRSACGLTRREKNPASAEGWRALSRETRLGSNGRRVQATRVGTRATACIPATLTHAMVRGATSDDEMCDLRMRKSEKNVGDSHCAFRSVDSPH
jgi:hypothetical protein